MKKHPGLYVKSFYSHINTSAHYHINTLAYQHINNFPMPHAPCSMLFALSPAVLSLLT